MLNKTAQIFDKEPPASSPVAPRSPKGDNRGTRNEAKGKTQIFDTRFSRLFPSYFLLPISPRSRISPSHESPHPLLARSYALRFIHHSRLSNSSLFIPVKIPKKNLWRRQKNPFVDVKSLHVLEHWEQNIK